ncbi:winged helix-turn-helix domain-containing protein [Streptomyces sp. NA04227]|uniref:AfsR/SARP family transcriptional regulator n=1 Tax=Streptomyces sp. NA04227 TaxID=2742136 RepID=UPI001591FB91|nr:BTAD domain-containing putative transcriptional regulator [Streptomyces sp. NA04227]QKW08912.1 winged helix-turn-helix domain-containing protein [Streptomyces sp. NA04227]
MRDVCEAPSGVWFGVLGQVEARRGPEPVRLRPGRERELLALLVLNAGRLLTAERVVDMLWEDPPGSARAQVYNLVSGLRRALGPEILLTVDGGYRLEAAAHSSDLAEFRTASTRGRGAADQGASESAAELLTVALGRWRGEALGDCAAPFAAAARQGLEDERLRALEALLDVQLGLGRYEEVLAEVGPWLERQPHREDLYRRQMHALAAQDRRADALATYRRAYRRLQDDLGVAPGPSLRRLQEQILLGALPAPVPAPASGPGPTTRPTLDPTPAHTPGPGPTTGPAPLTPLNRIPTQPHPPTPTPTETETRINPASPAPSTPPPPPTPRQLPPTPETLYGRAHLLTELHTALHRRGLAAPVVVLTGPGGVGKTALALHAGHRMAGRFPGGQLYADLRGSQAVPADAAQTTARFLRSLGVDGQDVPADPDERAAELRSRLAGRRMLLVLDDVHDENQIRPLLPGTGDCAVLATSRNRLTALTALADARVFRVSTLAPGDAVSLLAGLAGEERARAEAEATAEVAALCGHLPLALRIAGARLAARPDWTVRAFRDRLAQHHQRLDQLAVGDLDVRAGIDLSYRSLTPELRVALRRLGLLDAHSVPGWVLGSLTGVGFERAARLLDQLVERHLVEACGVDQAGQSRYQLHALVRDFAQERVLAEDSGAEREAALERLLGGWLSLASQAAGRLGHGGVLDPVPLNEEAPAAVALLVRQQPERWFAAEQASLIGAVHLACRLRRAELACDLALQLDSYLVIRFYEAEREAVIRAAIASCGEGPATDRRLSRLYFLLCWAMYQQDRYEELAQAAERGLRVATDLGDPEVVADASWQLGRATALRGALPEAAAYYRETVRSAEHLGLSERAHVYALTGLANVLADLGDTTAAVQHYDQALDRHRTPDRTRVVMLLRCAEALADGEQGLRARELLAEAGQLVGDIGDEVGAAHVARVHALADLADGDWPRARALLDSALGTLRAHRERSGTALAVRTLGDAALGAGEWTAAREHLGEARELHLRMALPVEIARTEARLAVALRLCGENAPADRHTRAYRDLLDRLRLPTSSLRLPGHVHRLLAAGDVAGQGGQS